MSRVNLAIVGRSALALFALLGALAGGYLVWHYVLFPPEEQGGGVRTLVPWLESQISPGPLCRAHAELDGPEGCRNCHTAGFKGFSRRLCLECHQDIKQRMDARLGFHGKVVGECQGCHTDHKGRDARIVKIEPARFNHDAALFQVTGAHHALDCDACHAVSKGERKFQKRFFLGLPRECGGCHQDPHEGQFTRACGECHLDHSWKVADLRFDHRTMSDYPLEGRHAHVACAKCHQGMKKFRPLERTCRSCHQDPHRGQFAADKTCATCHSPYAWTGGFLAFDHARDSTFRLTGAHAGVACARCHEQGNYRHGRTACRDCHADQHGGQFGAASACDRCHRTDGWTGPFLAFDHTRDSRYPLTGRHRLVACNKCHEGGQYRHARMQCRDCHTDPHQGRIAADCATCHRTAGWKGADVAFDHARDTSFALARLHGSVSCSACHADAAYRVTGNTCETCHADSEAFFAGGAFTALTPARPDPMHGHVKCTDCHRPEDPKADDELIRSRCIKCHNASYGPYLDQARARIEDRLQRVLERMTAAQQERVRPVVTAIRRFSPHNFTYALRLVQALEVGRAKPGQNAKPGQK